MSVSKPKQRYVLFAGNPGAGKSTLLNCLMFSEANCSLEEHEKFQSGISLGSGMTYQLDTKTQGGVVYMDTPGLSDTEKRKQAAAAITEALKRDGEYQIVFVVTLEAGRVRPDDVTTILLVLESAKEITHYGVVFNKLGKKVKKKMEGQDPLKLLSQISMQPREKKAVPVPLLLENHSGLHDEDDAVVDLPDLQNFVRCLPPISINQDNVEDISFDKFEALKVMLEKQLVSLREDNMALQRKMEEDREDFNKKLEEIIEENTGFLSKIPGIGPFANLIGTGFRKIF